MARRRPKAKRSLASLPKGLPQRNNNKHRLDTNPFEASRNKRAKYEVHNRPTSKQTSKQSALAKSLSTRQASLKNSLQSQKRANSIVDRRIGEYNHDMSRDEQMMARLVKERSRQSKRAQKYSLEEQDEQELTHKGRAIVNFQDVDHVMLSDDDEEDGGNLDAIDTELHFGGGASNRGSNRGEYAAYGPTNTEGDLNMSQLYSQKKTELDDLIARRKLMKAQRMKRNEEQEEAFETMDESFSEIAKMLQFRDKAKERKEREDKKASGNLSDDEQEMANWDKEMKTYLFERRVKATDRTKTPEEVAKEEAEQLHKLETRRLARMNGDFDQDDLTDISDDESKYKKKKAKQTKRKEVGGDELDDSDADDNDELQVKFTADGLMYIDKDGNPVKKVGDINQESEASPSSSSDEDDSSDEESDHDTELLEVGAKVQGNYRVKEQYDQKSAWYDGVITSVNQLRNGNVTYDVTYDGDFEENMDPENVRLIKKTTEEQKKEKFQQNKEVSTKLKRQKAKEKARKEIPFVFEVPTTLDALHDMIGNYASTGEDVSLIIQRIHKANSVRLNHKNREKMQNFYDVLLRRFIAVGDAIHSSGDGGPTLGRYQQLDELTKTLYAMAQDSPECAAAVWGRRLGFFQKAHAKRLRDAEFAMDGDDDFTAWPSTGTILLLRAVGHIFPVTDLRHTIVTPALLLLGQMLAQTPVRSLADAVMGLTCTGLMVEFTKDANRLAPEAISFLASMLRLFSIEPGAGDFCIPSLEAAIELPEFESLRETVSGMANLKSLPKLSLVQQDIESDTTPMAVLNSTLHLVECQVKALEESLDHAEAEAFAEITKSLVALKPKSKKFPLPDITTRKIAQVASTVSSACQLNSPRTPLQRRSGPSVSEKAIKSLAPRMEDPTRYSMSKDKNKTSVQAARDRARREYKREHKAVARELRLDAAFIESERRKEKDRKDSKARDKRNKNFAWLESEQAVMNQQVRQGGGLLSGGGMGAARAKARSGKVGIKKGGKLR